MGFWCHHQVRENGSNKLVKVAIKFEFILGFPNQSFYNGMNYFFSPTCHFQLLMYVNQFQFIHKSQPNTVKT